MKLFGVLFKLWALLCVLAAIALGAALWGDTGGMSVSVGDDLLDGHLATVLVTLIAAVALFATGVAIGLLVALVGVLVPCGLLLALAATLIGMGAAGIAVFGSLALVLSPVLIVVAGCVLLVRGLRRRRMPPLAST